jgi:hypothetical protein
MVHALETGAPDFGIWNSNVAPQGAAGALAFRGPLRAGDVLEKRRFRHHEVC